MRDEPLKRAIKAAGGVTRLSEALGITSAAVATWSSVPPRRMAQVATITGIPIHELRPDLVPAPCAAGMQAAS